MKKQPSRSRSRPARPVPAPAPRSRAPVWLYAAVIVAAGAWAYATSFGGVFVLDDVRAIARNASIRAIWPLSHSLWPPSQMTVSGRPVANFSFAINYALAPAAVQDVFAPGGKTAAAGTAERFQKNIAGYHLLNLAIHLSAALVLFGVVRRSLLTPRLRPRFDDSAGMIAFATALIWTVHPLQTESVTYVVQRVESLMGLFYLLTLYCAIRALAPPGRASESPQPALGVGPRRSENRRVPRALIESPPEESESASAAGRASGGGAPRAINRKWTALAILSCALGMATKEVMVTAPLVVLVWDWLFTAPQGRFWSRRRVTLYAGLAATWGVLALLVIFEHRAPSLGGRQDMWRYLLTQTAVITHYLRLSVVPAPLVLLYTWPLAASIADVPIQAALIGVLAALTIAGLARRHPLAFAGAWFFLVLAPTSSVLPIVTEVAAEHRMYLPLAAVVFVGVLAVARGGRALRGWLAHRLPLPPATRVVAGVALTIAIAMALAITTRARNRDYWSEEGLWADTLAKDPNNQRARLAYGLILSSSGRYAEAEEHLRFAVALNPDDPVAQGTLGTTYMVLRRIDEAIGPLARALALRPDYVELERPLGEAYAIRHQDALAVTHLTRAVAGQPTDPVLYSHLAAILADSRDPAVRDPARAVELATRAVDLTSRRDATALETWSVALAATGRFEAAAAAAADALAIARAQGNQAQVSEIEYRLAYYRSRVKGASR